MKVNKSMKKALRNHFTNDFNVQTLPDLHSSYILEDTAQVRIEYTYDLLYVYVAAGIAWSV